MPWGERNVLPGAGKPRDESLRADYRKLISLRKNHPALWRGVHTALNTEGDALVYSKQDPESDDFVIIAINRGARALNMSIQRPAPWSGKAVKDVWNETTVDAEGDKLEFTIDPKSARILLVE